ncbi:hypothetical protein TNCV_3547621 [Trichonephila clavipes]|nr:hypothetical protein TNCV_3547621 [Trichonephila clavipes]
MLLGFGTIGRGFCPVNMHHFIEISGVNECTFMSPYHAVQGLLATDVIILNHDHVMRTTPELNPHLPSSNYYTTPMGGRLSLDRFIEHRLLIHGGTRLELMTCQPRVRDLNYYAITATKFLV